MANKDLLYATSLKISGELNDKDLETIKGLRKVETLDLTEAIINDLPDKMYYRNKTIKSIKLPKSITTIHPKTFTYSSLEYVYMPTNIVKIEDGECDNSKYIVIGAFSETPLRNVEFEKNSKLKYIGDGSFSGCGIIHKRYDIKLHYASLDITLPASVEHIGSLVFGDTHWYETDSGVYTEVNVNFEKESNLK